jgi:hypothetical protein
MAAPHAGESWEIGVSASYRQWSFDFGGQVVADREVPRAVYRQVELGLDGRKRFGPVSIFAHLAYVQLLTIKSLRTRMPANPSAGTDFRLGAALHFTRWFAIEAYGNYALAWYHLYPLPDRSDLKAVVFDHTLDVYLGPRFTF